MQLDKNWNRYQRFDVDRFKAARDIIRYCTLPKHDKLFAKKHNLSLATVSKIRLGRSWRKLRRKMKREEDDRQRRFERPAQAAR